MLEDGVREVGELRRVRPGRRPPGLADAVVDGRHRDLRADRLLDRVDRVDREAGEDGARVAEGLRDALRGVALLPLRTRAAAEVPLREGVREIAEEEGRYSIRGGRGIRALF